MKTLCNNTQVERGDDDDENDDDVDDDYDDDLACCDNIINVILPRLREDDRGR